MHVQTARQHSSALTITKLVNEDCLTLNKSHFEQPAASDRNTRESWPRTLSRNWRSTARRRSMPASQTRTRRGTAGRTTWIIIAAKKLWMPKVSTQLHVIGTRGSSTLSVLFPGLRNGTPKGKMERFLERSEDRTVSKALHQGNRNASVCGIVSPQPNRALLTFVQKCSCQAGG
ncbi:hypothetical protein Q8A67_024851 [Cirrhinus molitorella]|uniref:Uncharacterized protein n=1 Tax=Cirrhinus molitorella TaxID=172907 RepID=A0AA88P5B7_9TELE|nr:hypothetical protein Q8A67_024851 [Cirrhinus molitorella]